MEPSGIFVLQVVRRRHDVEKQPVEWLDEEDGAAVADLQFELGPEALVIDALREIEAVVGEPAVVQRLLREVEARGGTAVLVQAIDADDIVGGGREDVSPPL